jgi:hypothetical protein
MKKTIVIALTLVSVSAFAAKMTPEQKACVKTAKSIKDKAERKAAVAACKAAPTAEAKAAEVKTDAPAAK